MCNEERKNPRMHFSALSALWKAKCVRRQYCFPSLLACWGVANVGALWLAVAGPCDLLCGLMQEGRPRGHSLSLCVCIRVLYVTVWCRITGYTHVHGVATTLPLTRVHALSLARSHHTRTRKVIQAVVLLGLSYLGLLCPCARPSFLLLVLLDASWRLQPWHI